MAQRALEQLHDYCDFIARDEREFQVLASEIAVPETWFFRYPASFEFLREQFLLRRTHNPDALTIASLGCATGVEPWCIAACALSAGWSPARVKIHAIDRSPLALESARGGKIPGGSVRSALPNWASPWIRSVEASITLADELLQCIEFRQQDILTTPNLFDQPIDVLFCRNVMIYLSAAARMLLRERFLEWIPEGGLLFLGHADGLTRGRELECAGPTAAFAWRRLRVVSTQESAVTVTRKIPTGQFAPTKTRPSTKSVSSIPTPQPSKPAESAPTVAQIHGMIVAGEFDASRRALEAALLLDPSNFEMLELLAGVYSAQNEIMRAVQTYGRVVYLQPDHGPALLALAELSEAIGRKDDATRYRARLKRLGDL